MVIVTPHQTSQTAIDVLSRRARLGQVNGGAAEYALPRVIELMCEVRKWHTSRHTVEYARRVVETVERRISDSESAMQQNEELKVSSVCFVLMKKVMNNVLCRFC